MSIDLTVLHVGVLALAACVFILAGLSDARRYKIPNVLVLALLLFYPAYVLSSPVTIDWLAGLAVFSSLLLLGYVFFLKNIIGAGDVKLLAAAGLWAGTSLLAVFLFVTAIVGGIICAFVVGSVWMKSRYGDKKTDLMASLLKVPVPYGLAIAAGGIAMLLHHFQFLSHG